MSKACCSVMNIANDKKVERMVIHGARTQLVHVLKHRLGMSAHMLEIGWKNREQCVELVGLNLLDHEPVVIREEYKRARSSSKFEA